MRAEGLLRLMVDKKKAKTSHPSTPGEELALLLLRLGGSLCSATDFDAALAEVLDAAILISSMDSGGIYLRDTTTGTLDLACQTGLGARFVEQISHVPSDSNHAKIVGDGQTRYWTSLSEDQPLRHETAFRQEGLTAVASVPILFRECVVGTINVSSRSATEIPIEARKSLEHLASQVGGMVGRLRMEEALFQSEELYRTTIDSMHDAIHVVDTDLRVVLYNGIFREKTLKLAGERYPTGKLLTEILPFMPDTVKGEYEQVIATGEELVTEERVTVNSDWLTIKVIKIPIRDSSGRVVRVLTIVRDITERRRLEAELRQATKMESVGRLAGGVAHDFNNLLTAITAHARFAARALPQDSAAAKDLEQVLKAASRAEALTKQLLAFSRRQVLEPRNIALNDHLLEISTLLRRMIPANVEIHTVMGDELWTVKADPDQIGQVLLNLAVNACDAMPRGGELRLETSNVVLDEEFTGKNPGSTTGEFVRLAVTDNGTGIDDEVAKHLFEPFFTTKEQGKGTGLGLATVYGTVKQHHGYIAVESELGRGTCFAIYLPRILGEPERGLTRVPRKPRGSGGETILVVEDEPQVRRAMVRILKRMDYEIIQAVNGNDALRVAAEHQGPIDLVLTDIVMPNMGGADLVAELSQHRPEIAVLFVSGYPRGSLTEDGELDANAAFLRKPFEPDTLANMVRDLLDSRQGD